MCEPLRALLRAADSLRYRTQFFGRILEPDTYGNAHRDAAAMLAAARRLAAKCPKRGPGLSLAALNRGKQEANKCSGSRRGKALDCRITRPCDPPKPGQTSQNGQNGQGSGEGDGRGQADVKNCFERAKSRPEALLDRCFGQSWIGFGQIRRQMRAPWPAWRQRAHRASPARPPCCGHSG